ncbi:RNA chaperone Hfq [Bacillus sp. UMB0893]|uniref:RNA chaperone Hfq n=1 Tax=Bacillus sp. UMB0893 TaxID=2066053 RepID=UPI0008A88F0D|nr:RNA chaperone Hfq [Bacillus sp. UMB0893]OHR74073.1 hypothetical protein HMPREF3291_00135 [Bacillus sp. HMSC76G11]PLR65629.1 hypothetical protein CYJ36_22530 [Bacillus sp. UMB0893]
MTTAVKSEQKPKKRNPHHTQNRLYHKYLNQSVVIHMLTGLKVKGKLLEYDHYCIAVLIQEDEILIFKHAIALIRPNNPERENTLNDNE